MAKQKEEVQMTVMIPAKLGEELENRLMGGGQRHLKKDFVAAAIKEKLDKEEAKANHG